MGERAYLVLALLISTLLLWTHFYIPLNVDNDLYQCMGFEIAHFGRLPYIGSWAHTLPGMAYIHAAAILSFGNSALSFRIVDVLVHLGTVAFLYGLLREWFQPSVSALAGVLWILYYISEGYWLAGQPDGFAVFFIVAGTYYFLKRKHGATWAMLTVAGVLMALATLIRPTYGLFLVSLPVVSRTKKGSLVPYLVGILIPTLLMLGPYLFISGGVYQLYEAVLGFNFESYGAIRVNYNAMQLLMHPYTLLSLTCFVPRPDSVPKIPNVAKRLAITYLFCGLISLYVMGKFFVYHFDPIFCLLSVLAAYGIIKCINYIPKRLLRLAVLAVIILWMFRRFYPFDLFKYVRESWMQDHVSSLQFVQHKMKSDSDVGLPAEEAVCSFLSRPENDSGAIEFCSVNPAVRWESERREATRFTMIHALGVHGPGTPLSDFQRKCRAEFLDSLESVKPHFVILSTVPDHVPLLDYHSPAQIVRSIPGVDSLLKVRYQYDTTIGAFQVYRYKPNV